MCIRICLRIRIGIFISDSFTNRVGTHCFYRLTGFRLQMELLWELVDLILATQEAPERPRNDKDAQEVARRRPRVPTGAFGVHLEALESLFHDLGTHLGCLEPQF